MDIKDIEAQMFTGPVPGQALTDEPGAFAWEQPPMVNTVEEAFDYYVAKISDEEVSDNILGMLDLGMPVSVVTGAMLSKGIMDGIHTVDVKLILQPQLGVMIKKMADEAGISYKETMNDYLDKDGAAKRKRMKLLATKLAIRKQMKDMDEGDKIQEIAVEEVMEEPAEQEEPKGLMVKE